MNIIIPVYITPRPGLVSTFKCKRGQQQTVPTSPTKSCQCKWVYADAWHLSAVGTHLWACKTHDMKEVGYSISDSIRICVYRTLGHTIPPMQHVHLTFRRTHTHTLYICVCCMQWHYCTDWSMVMLNSASSGHYTHTHTHVHTRTHTHQYLYLQLSQPKQGVNKQETTRLLITFQFWQWRVQPYLYMQVHGTSVQWVLILWVCKTHDMKEVEYSLQ